MKRLFWFPITLLFFSSSIWAQTFQTSTDVNGYNHFAADSVSSGYEIDSDDAFSVISNQSVADDSVLSVAIDTLVTDSVRLVKPEEYVPVVAQISPSNFRRIRMPKEVVESHRHVRTRMRRRPLENNHISNNAVRFAIQDLKNTPKLYDGISSPLNRIINYAESKELNEGIGMVKSYMDNWEIFDDALRKIRYRNELDSLRYANSALSAGDSVDPFEVPNPELRLLMRYIEQDSNFQWLVEKTRDSVEVTIYDIYNRPQSYWINNGRLSSYRYTTENLLGDTIQAWVQFMPDDRAMKFYLDPYVRQIKVDELAPEVVSERQKTLKRLDLDVSGKMDKLNAEDVNKKIWRSYSDLNFNFGQGYISKNWSAGGSSSLTVLFDGKHNLNYAKDGITVESYVRYRVGALKSGSEPIIKNEDKFELQSKAGVTAIKKWKYAAQLDINTTFFNSYNTSGTRIASFLSPGYFVLSLGMNYKPTSKTSIYVAPISGKLVTMADTTNIDAKPYGIPDGHKSLWTGGTTVEVNSTYSPFSFMSLDNKVVIFYDYFVKNTSGKGTKLKYTTFNWQLTAKFTISYFLQTSIYMNTVYNYTQHHRLQMKETLNIGISLRL